jgi:putative ABC transport system permease protein
MLGHAQIHLKGYTESIDTLPLTHSITREEYNQIKNKLQKNKNIQAVSPRLRFNGLISNYNISTNIRIFGISPDDEIKVSPTLASRVIKRVNNTGGFPVQKGGIVIPDNLASSMNIKINDTIVIVATNKDGSVNALNLKVIGILDKILGPGGKDSYVHIEDAGQILRTSDIHEIALRTNSLDNVKKTVKSIKNNLNNKFEIHPWQAFSPFSTIANVIDIMFIFLQILLVTIILVSIMNVMLMAVYERIREVGTLMAIGTRPKAIMMMFFSEAFFLGLFSLIIGIISGVGVVYILNLIKINFTFGTMDLILEPTISIGSIISLFIIVMVFTVIATIIPARKAKNLEPIDALRFN